MQQQVIDPGKPHHLWVCALFSCQIIWIVFEAHGFNNNSQRVLLLLDSGTVQNEVGDTREGAGLGVIVVVFNRREREQRLLKSKAQAIHIQLARVGQTIRLHLGAPSPALVLLAAN